MASQQDRARSAFTLQAETYANSAIIAAEEARRRFVAFVEPRSTDLVLDVATGPGFLAFLFAEQVARVVGLDLTPAMLRRAEAERLVRGHAHVGFQAAVAEALPFATATFDLCTCGSAFHHFADPAAVLAEMIRVVRPGGRVALIDIISSEWPAKAELHNRLERERDPSHVRCLPLSELVMLFGRAGLLALRTFTYTTPRELGEWFAISRTPAEVAEQVRAGFLAAMADDAAGLRIRWEGGRLCFDHTFAWVVGTRPGRV